MTTLESIKSGQLPVMEAFYTLQGEGFHNGKAAYFIRLAGCDVGCVWCDVKASWESTPEQFQTVKNIVEGAKQHLGKLIVITGGEPLMYDLEELTSVLKSESFILNIETSGAYPISGHWDWICFSPKKFKKPLEEFYTKANELKIIIFNKSDFKFAEEHASKMNNNAVLLLQPEWDKRAELMPEIVEYVKQNPKWRVSLQTHKYLDIP